MSMTDNIDIDHEAIGLLNASGWHWSDNRLSFEKGRDPNKETTEEYRSRPRHLISYEELKNNNLVGEVATKDREAGLQWLRRKISTLS